MYVCSRTLIRYFVAWRSQSVYHTIHLLQRGTEHEKSEDEKCRAATPWQEKESGQSIPQQGTSFQRRHVVGNTLYTSGQEGTDDSDKLVVGGIGPETTAALGNIQKVLKAAGFDLKDVVGVTVYIADIHEFADMNQVYKNVLPRPQAGARNHPGSGPGQQRAS